MQYYTVDIAQAGFIGGHFCLNHIFAMEWTIMLPEAHKVPVSVSESVWNQMDP